MRLLLSFALAASLAACGGFDAGTPYRTRPIEAVDETEPEAAVDPADDGDASSPSIAGDDGDDDTGRAPDPDPTPSGDAGASAGAFSGADAYSATLGPTARQGGHAFASATPATNPAGRPCLQCHGAGGPAPRFAFAGTIYKDALQTPAPRVQVRVVGADGAARVTFTDADGNFFFRFTSGAVKFPALVGARDADTTKLMTIDATNGNCNGCHRAGGTEPQIVVK